MAAAGKEISRLVDESQKLFHAIEGQQTWHEYLEFIDNLVIDGLLHAVATSIGFLLDETDPSLTQGILFEVRLELSEPDIIFCPPLDKNLTKNFYDQMAGYIEDVFHMCELIPRVAKHKDASYTSDRVAQEEVADKSITEKSVAEDESEGTEPTPPPPAVGSQDVPNYLRIISQHRELRQMKDLLMSRVTDVMSRANKLKFGYLEHSYLWTESRTEFMHYFLTYSRQLTTEEIESLEEDEKAIKKQYPSLEQFKEQIDTYENLHDQLKNIDNLKILQHWFRVDIKPFKQSLLTCIKRWSYAFKKHLLEHVVKSLSDLNDFIEKADEGLMQQVQEGDYDGLLKVMEFLQVSKLLCAAFYCFIYHGFRSSKKSRPRPIPCLSHCAKSSTC